MLTPTMSFAAAIDEVATAALSTLPQALHERLARAVALCETGCVWMAEDGIHAQVQSSDGEHFYTVNGTCACPDATYRGIEGRCQHALAVKLYRKAVQRIYTSQPAPVEATTPAGIDPRFIVTIQSKPFVRHAGLLKLAHERGLQELRVDWTYNDAELSLAHALAVFPFGTFEESGDAAKENVNKKVAPHWRRVALTRASARALRLALGVELVAVEELAED
jgi:hypothetical protein